MSLRAIITVVGRDMVGIIARISAILAKNNVNILDISQSVLKEFFTMVMLVDMEKCPIPFDELQKQLDEEASGMGMSARILREDVFQAMHRL
jgi:ACT domain-containing protein